MSDILNICAEIAEKIPQVYEAGKKAGDGAPVPNVAEIAKRTSLSYWYQYLMKNHYIGFDDDTYEEAYFGELIESVEYPQGTQDITDFSNLAGSYIANNLAGGMYQYHGLYTKRFCGTLDTSSGTNFQSMFAGCDQAEDFGELSDTSKGIDFNSMFAGCNKLTTPPSLDVRNANIMQDMFYYCIKLTNLNIKNIKVTLRIGSGSSWGHLLTVDSLVNTIYECRDTGSTKTLTVGSANLSKLADVYVKLIDITDEMRTNDDLIDEKKPFEVCESTDEGAMLITDYVGLKNWKLA